MIQFDMKLNKTQVLIGLFVLFLILGIFLMSYLQSVLRGSTMSLGIDLYPRWVGSQLALHGGSPYTLAARQQIWLAIYGSTEVPNGNPFGFYYPPAIVTLLAPFIFLGISVTTAAMVWCALIWALFSTFLIGWTMSLPRLAQARLIVPLLLLGGWFFRPAFSNYILGQFALFSVLMVIAAWLCFEKEMPVLGGILCTLSLIKPSLTILPVILLFVLYRQQITGLGWFLVSSLVLYLIPTILLGWWLPDFLKDISGYALENEVAWSALDIRTVPGLIWLVLAIPLIALGIQTKDNALSLAAILGLNSIFVPHTADYDLVSFIPLLVYISYDWLFSQKQKVLLTTLFLILLWFPWLSLLYFLINQQGSTHIVEAWYRFIWLTYPNLIMGSVLLTKLPRINSLFYQFRNNRKPFPDSHLL
jgi:hypothetical protein